MFTTLHVNSMTGDYPKTFLNWGSWPAPSLFCVLMLYTEQRVIIARECLCVATQTITKYTHIRFLHSHDDHLCQN